MDAPHIVPARRSIFYKLWPLGPIFNKELREMARRKRTYWLRICYLLLLLSVLGLTWLAMNDSYRYSQTSVAMQAQRQAEMGQIFFTVFALFSITAMHLIGPVLTSTAIGSERLRRTFDALLMTPISAWQLVGGKLFSRLLTAFMLIGLTLPVLAIVRLLGGLELVDVFGSLALSACVAMSSASIGLLLSCWIKRAWAVILLAYIIQGLIYGLFPILAATIAMQMLYRSMGNSAMQWLWEVIAVCNPLMTAGIKIASPRGIVTISWTASCAMQLVLTFILTLTASLVVRRISRRESGSRSSAPVQTSADAARALAAMTSAPPVATDTPAATQLPISTGAVPPPLPQTLQRPVACRQHRDVGENPILWRELRRPLLPRRWMKIVAVTVTLGLLLLTYLCFNLDYNGLNDKDVHVGYAIIMHAMLMLMAVILSATAIATEKESDTWTLLIATPISGQQIMWAKFIGVLKRLFWPWTILFLHMAIFTLAGVVSVWATILVLWVSITFNLLWVATGLYFSLRLTKVTSAVVCNLMLPVLLHGISSLVLAAIQFSVQDLRRSELAEVTLYWLPFYYIGVGIDRMSRMYGYSYRSHSDISSVHAFDRLVLGDFYLPMSDFNRELYWLLFIGLAAGLVMMIISLLIIWWTGFRFDRYVHRAADGKAASDFKSLPAAEG